MEVHRHVMKLAAALYLLCGWHLPGTAQVVEQRVRAAGFVRVCIWPGYFGVTYRDPRTQQLKGIDIDLSSHLARDLGLAVRYVDSSFSTLIEDLQTDRCDVAMFAVGVLPQRAAQLRFTRPYPESGIYGVTTRSNRSLRGVHRAVSRQGHWNLGFVGLPA
jgi:ABC-type amino acid transport substrate-binding protein